MMGPAWVQGGAEDFSRALEALEFRQSFGAQKDLQSELHPCALDLLYRKMDGSAPAGQQKEGRAQTLNKNHGQRVALPNRDALRLCFA